jgi:hypothetical protein
LTTTTTVFGLGFNGQTALQKTFIDVPVGGAAVTASVSKTSKDSKTNRTMLIENNFLPTAAPLILKFKFYLT